MSKSKTFCYGSVTKSTSFFVKIFSSKSKEELQQDLSFFLERREKGVNNNAQIQAIEKLLEKVA